MGLGAVRRGSQGIMPCAAQPIGDQANGLFAQDLVCAESGHAIVSLAIKVGVGGIVDKIDQPLARAVAGQVGAGGLFIFVAELVAIRALKLVEEQRAAFFDHRGVALVGGKLRLELGFGRNSRKHLDQIGFLLGRVSSDFFLHKLTTLRTFLLRILGGCVSLVESTNGPF